MHLLLRHGAEREAASTPFRALLTTFETSPRLLSFWFGMAAAGVCSLRLDAEHVVADLHEREHVHLRGDGGFLSLREMELRVGQGHQGFKMTVTGKSGGHTYLRGTVPLRCDRRSSSRTG